MPRFFLPPSDCRGDFIALSGGDAYHVSRSLRMAVGDGLTVCDGSGSDIVCVIDSFSEGKVLLRVTERRRSVSEMPVAVTVYQALVKGDRLDTAVRKSVECGASEIVLFEGERSILRADALNAGKLERYRRIAAEAAGQSGRGIVPAVSFCGGGEKPAGFREAADSAAKSEISLFCYEGETDMPIGRALPGSPPASLSFIIGPEGGFSLSEAGYAAERGLTAVSLGKRILRTESAAPFVLACISFKYELS